MIVRIITFPFFFSSRRRHTRCALVTGFQTCALPISLARRFHAGGYRVAMLPRDASRLGALAEELPGSIAIGCDVGDPAALAQALDRAAAEGGDPKVLIHNAVGGAIGSFLDVEPSVLEAN